MHYEQLLDKLLNINTQKGVKLGLSQMQKLSTTFGHPEKKFRSVHIAGSNGKGSVACKIAKGLEQVYPKVGLFTSPHISTFRERIRINGQMITEDEFKGILNQIIDEPGTFFELTTLAAFLYFAEKEVDFAVIETGLGGRLDATNIVTPELSVITSISLEHTEFLGDTIEQIASEKAGIIKPGVPVVLGPKASMITSPQAIQVKGSFSTVDEENSAIAKKSMELLKLPCDVVEKALTKRPNCRMEQKGNMILDVAHNPDALERYFQEDRRRPLQVICALSKNKDLQKCLSIISQHADSIYLVEAPNGRSAQKSTLRELLLDMGFPKDKINDCATIPDAVKSVTVQGDTAVIGSFFIMSEARKTIGVDEPVDRLEMNEHVTYTQTTSRF